MTTAREQAAGAAQAAVPTKQSIMQQYGQSIGDVSGFTKALMGLLQQGPGVAAGYAPAIAQQQGVTNAAQQRIAALTGGAPAQLGSQVAVGGMGDSAVSHLIASQAAARTYGAQLPRAAAARGQLAQQSLITGRNQALQQRSQQYQSAFQQALAQALQNRMAMRQFNANLGLQRDQMAQQANQFDRTLRAENHRYFAGLDNQRLLASLRSGASGGSTVTRAGILNGTGLTRATGLSAAGVNAAIAKADEILQPALKTKATAIYGYQNPQTGQIGRTEPAGAKFPRVIIGYRNIPIGGGGDPVSSGVPFATALRELEGQGIAAPIAFYAAAKLYAGSVGTSAGSQPGNAAYNSFVRWMAQNGFKGYQRRLSQRRRQSGGPQNAGLPQ